MSGSVLAVFMEPAPYVTGLIRELRSAWKGGLDVLFIDESLTQTWSFDPSEYRFLPKGSIVALLEIRRHLLSGNYKLLHLAGWGHPVLFGAILLAKLSGVTIAVETDTPAPLVEKRWRRLLKRFLYPVIFSLPRIFFPAGRRQAAYLQEYGVECDRIRQSNMTVDVSALDKFATQFAGDRRSDFRKRLGIPETVRTIILYVGRLEKYKGVYELFDAYIRLRVDRSDVALLVAGSGSLELFVSSAASSIRSILYLGHLKGEQVWEAYCASDLFVLPSRRDSWGLAVNEAMAAGLPVVVSGGAGCVDDLVVPGVTGLIVQPCTGETLYRAMRDLVGDSELRRRMGTAARKLIARWTLADEAKIIASSWATAIRYPATAGETPRSNVLG